MPTTAVQTYSGTKLEPLINPEEAYDSIFRVALPASVTYPQGTWVGEVIATPGTYKAYVAANVDGSQNPVGVLQYPCSTDALGNITIVGEWGQTHSSAPMYTRGTYRTAELVQGATPGAMDAAGLTKVSGHLVEGTFVTGVLSF